MAASKQQGTDTDSSITVSLTDASLLRRLLSASTKSLIDGIEIFETIDSTNAEAMRQLQSGSQGCKLLMAECQTQGRGRRGKEWVSVGGAGVYLSLIWPIADKSSQLPGISLVTALSLQAVIEQLGGTGVGLKWPNDVVSQGKKLAGILLQVSNGSAHRAHLVIGVGINITLPRQVIDAIDQPVTDLTSILRQPVDRTNLLALYLDELIANLSKFMECGFAPFRQRWNQLDLYRNQLVRVQQGSREIEAKSLGVNDFGELLLATEQGEVAISGGEVVHSLRPVRGGDRK